MKKMSFRWWLEMAHFRPKCLRHLFCCFFVFLIKNAKLFHIVEARNRITQWNEYIKEEEEGGGKTLWKMLMRKSWANKVICITWQKVIMCCSDVRKSKTYCRPNKNYFVSFVCYVVWSPLHGNLIAYSIGRRIVVFFSKFIFVVIVRFDLHILQLKLHSFIRSLLVRKKEWKHKINMHRQRHQHFKESGIDLKLNFIFLLLFFLVFSSSHSNFEIDILTFNNSYFINYRKSQRLQ